MFLNKTAAAAAKSLQSCLTLCDPIDGGPPGSPVPGILQARTLEWVASSFSNARKWKVKVKSLSRVRLLVTPWTTAHPALRPWDFPGKSTGVGCHCLLRNKTESLLISKSLTRKFQHACHQEVNTSTLLHHHWHWVQLLSHVWLFVTPWTAAYQASLSTECKTLSASWRHMCSSCFPGGASGKGPTCQCRRPKRHGFDPWIRKIP